MKATYRTAEELARTCDPAEMPSLDHLSMSDYNNVYEPSDDSYLLLDALNAEFGTGAKRVPSVRTTLEMGCGTGVATVCLARLLLERHLSRSTEPSANTQSVPYHIQHYVTDINPDAIRITTETARANHIPHGAVQPIKCDLATPLLPLLSNQVDVLIFNPPYVPTPVEEVGSASIEASWAGGTDGRVVLDRALPQIASLLSWPDGCAYVITVDDNFPEEIEEIMWRDYGIRVVPLVRRKAINEFLTVLKMTLTRKL